MKRRDCVKLLAATALAPAWLRRAFADVSVHADGVELRDGPSLVLVIPRDDNAKWDRGDAFGALLQHASDGELAPLALVDLVAQPAATFGVAGDPLMILVPGKSDGDAPKLRILDGKLPPPPVVARSTIPEQVRVASRQRVALLARLIGDALARLRACDRRSDATLAAIARARYVEEPPRGVHWAHSTMCGLEVEGAPELADQVDCGMGALTDESRRFLYLFTRRRR